MPTVDPLIEQLTAIDTPTLSNAIERLQVRSRISGFCDRSIRCVFPDLGVLCGFAVTAEVETMAPERADGPDEVFIDLCRALEASPRPSVVVLREVGPHPEFSAHCGEVMATTFRRLGAVGLLCDGAVRDLPEVRALGFRYFAPGAVASHGNFHLVRVGPPVTIGGLAVAPGDLLHGDANGLIKVPQEGRERLAALAAEVTGAEGKILEFVKGQSFSIEGLKGMLARRSQAH